MTKCRQDEHSSKGGKVEWPMRWYTCPSFYVALQTAGCEANSLPPGLLLGKTGCRQNLSLDSNVLHLPSWSPSTYPLLMPKAVSPNHSSSPFSSHQPASPAGKVTLKCRAFQTTPVKTPLLRGMNPHAGLSTCLVCAVSFKADMENITKRSGSPEV